MRQLGGSDHIWFAMDTRHSPMHMLMVNIYEPAESRGGRVDLDGIKQHLDERMASLPLRDKLLTVPFNVDYPYWIEDEDFHLDNHVFHTRLGAPYNWDGLLQTMQDLCEPSLDHSRPLWEMHLITGLGRIRDLPRGSYALALKVHHAQFDGTNLFRLLNRLHSDPEESGDRRSAGSRGRVPPSSVGLLARAAWNNYAWGWRTAWTIGKNMPNIIATASAARASRAEKKSERPPPRTRFSGRITSRERVFDSVDIPLSDIHRIRRKIDGATVNDAALTLAGGALRLYLAAHNELPEDPLLVACPVSAHDAEEEHETGNKGSMMLVTLHTDIADPMERLVHTHRETQRAKDQTERLGASNVADIVDVLPTNLLSYGMDLITRTALAEKVNVGALSGSGIGITNVPGSREPLHLGGDRLIKGLGVGFLADGAGLLLAITSYHDTLQLQFISCPDMMPDPKFFKACIEDAIRDMSEA